MANAQIADQLWFLGLENNVPCFDGNASKITDWLKAIDICAIINNIAKNNKIKIALRFSTGRVSDFIHSFIEKDPNATWDYFKINLLNRFGITKDNYVQLTKLRSINQYSSENIQLYADRLLELAYSAYKNFDLRNPVIEFELIGYFIDGLLDLDIQKLLIKENPKTFQNAIEIAFKEQDLKLKLESRLQSNNKMRQRNESKYRLDNFKPMEIDILKRGRFCKFCRRSGHLISECKKRILHNQNLQTHVRRQESKARLQCYFCNKLGHKQSDCKEKQEFDFQSNRQQNRNVFSKNM
jgi:hypothetical protein